MQPRLACKQKLPKSLRLLQVLLVNQVGHLRAARGVRLCERSERGSQRFGRLLPLEDSLRARLISLRTAKVKNYRGFIGRQ